MESKYPHERSAGRYVIHGELASGGMATVHLGQLLGPAGFARTVAIKRLHEHLANDPEFVTMLLDEAKLVSSIHHPNVVSTLDIVCETDDLLIVMDYVEGENLANLLGTAKRSGCRPPTKGVISRIVLDALAGLHAAHTAKTHNGHQLHIVHRDVSPQNIIVGVDGVARVLDFGVAKGERRRHSTRPGRIKGKFAYMSPEQVRGSKVDARTDVFATGIVLWECLAGRRLFAHGDREQGIERVLTMAVPPPSAYDTTLSLDVDSVVLRALSRDPSLRFSSALEFAQALHAALPPACPTEVGAWVAEVAKGSLVGHAHLFRDLENSTISGARSGRSPLLRDSRTISEPFPRIRAVPNDAPTVASGPLAAESNGRATRSPSRRTLWIAIAAASLCGLAALVFGSSNAEPPAALGSMSPTGTVSPPAPRVSSTATVHPASVGPVRSADPVEELPAVALPLEEEAAETAPPPQASHGPAPKRGSVPRRQRSSRPPSSPSLPKAEAATKVATAPGLEQQAPSRPAPSCDPPYRVDELGVRRVRRECL